MIVLYYTLSSRPCRKAVKWFKDQEIRVLKIKINRISKVNLLRVLSLSENGFEDLLKKPNQYNVSTQKLIQKVFDMSFNDGVEFILKHPEMLKVPIMIDGNKLIIGFNYDKVRTFIPKDYRSLERL